jgi:hypothetical protein
VASEIVKKESDKDTLLTKDTPIKDNKMPIKVGKNAATMMIDYNKTPLMQQSFIN